MIEAEALAKWCPHAVASHTDPRQILNGHWLHSCIGSACMAWRWDEPKRTAAFLEAVQAHMQASAKPNFNTSVQAVYAETGGKFARTEGYCGLAGAVSP